LKQFHVAAITDSEREKEKENVIDTHGNGFESNEAMTSIKLLKILSTFTNI
jgi:hypothetical protein